MCGFAQPEQHRFCACCGTPFPQPAPPPEPEPEKTPDAHCAFEPDAFRDLIVLQGKTVAELSKIASAAIMALSHAENRLLAASAGGETYRTYAELRTPAERGIQPLDPPLQERSEDELKALAEMVQPMDGDAFASGEF